MAKPSEALIEVAREIVHSFVRAPDTQGSREPDRIKDLVEQFVPDDWDSPWEGRFRLLEAAYALAIYAISRFLSRGEHHSVVETLEEIIAETDWEKPELS